MPKNIFNKFSSNPYGGFLIPEDEKNLNNNKSQIEKNCNFCRKNAKFRHGKILNISLNLETIQLLIVKALRSLLGSSGWKKLKNGTNFQIKT